MPGCSVPTSFVTRTLRLSLGSRGSTVVPTSASVDPLELTGRQVNVRNSEWDKGMAGSSKCTIDGFVDKLDWRDGTAHAYALETGGHKYAFTMSDVVALLAPLQRNNLHARMADYLRRTGHGESILQGAGLPIGGGRYYIDRSPHPARVPGRELPSVFRTLHFDSSTKPWASQPTASDMAKFRASYVRTLSHAGPMPS